MQRLGAQMGERRRAEEAAKRLADTDCLSRPSLDAAMAELMRGAEAS